MMDWGFKSKPSLLGLFMLLFTIFTQSHLTDFDKNVPLHIIIIMKLWNVVATKLRVVNVMKIALFEE